MSDHKLSYLLCFINCVFLKFIFAQIDQNSSYTLSLINSTSNQLFTNSFNKSFNTSSTAVDSNENIVQSIDNSTGLAHLIQTTFQL